MLQIVFGKTKTEQKQESADFHNIVVFGRQAEIANQYLKKGGSVLVEGRMQTRSWDGPDGKKNYRTEVIADRIQFGQRAGSAMGGGHNDQGSSSNNQSSVVSRGKKSEPVEELDTISYPADEINPDDIPF